MYLKTDLELVFDFVYGPLPYVGLRQVAVAVMQGA